MSWKGLVIEKPARLSLRLGQLLLDKEDAQYSIPLEDLSFIVFDSKQVVTTALLSACAESGCLVLTTNARHLPNGMLQSFPSHHRQLETIELQMSASEPCKKRLWQTLIQCKIANQAECLRALRLPGENKVAYFCKRVRSGDPENVEGQAARAYWGLMEGNFRRDSEGSDKLNALLNYGYALVRSALAQRLAAHGFVPAMGLHHCNRHNPFNLADDLIEPWRPFVDYRAVSRWRISKEDELSTEDRRQMLEIFYDQVYWKDCVQTILSALNPYVEQLRECMNEPHKKFICPMFQRS